MKVAGEMRSLPVCDMSGALFGIIGRRDLLRAVRGGHPAAATAAALGRQPALTIGADDPIDGVRDVMAEQRMRLLPVLDGRRLAGVIHDRAHHGARSRGHRFVATGLTPDVP